MVQLHVNVVQPPVVQLWFQVVPRAQRVVQVFAPEAGWWWCGGGVVVWWVRVNQCKVVLGDMEVLLWWSFHDSKISSEIEEAPRQNLLTLLKQFWSKNDKMPKYNLAILLYELLSKML